MTVPPPRASATARLGIGSASARHRLGIGAASNDGHEGNGGRMRAIMVAANPIADDAVQVVAAPATP